MASERLVPSQSDFAALGMAVTACANLEDILRKAFVLTQLNGRVQNDNDQRLFFDALNSGLSNAIRHINPKVESSQDLTQPEKDYLNSIFKDESGSSEGCNFVVWRNVLCHAPMKAIGGGKLYFEFYDRAVFSSLSGSNPFEKETCREELLKMANSFAEADRLLRLVFVKR